jgi:hypothetical protein
MKDLEGSDRSLIRVLSSYSAADRVRSQVRSCGICGGESGTGADFIRVFRFPLPFLILPTAPHLSSIIRGW